MGARTLGASIALALAATALGAWPAAAAPPKAGVLVPGESLGGIRIGITKAEVRQRWGARFGRCRSCVLETWYFTYRPFTPEGAAVGFERGRVVRVYTLWQPAGWKTTSGLALGAPESRVPETYGALPRSQCVGYAAAVLVGEEAASVFYFDGGELWGFGLTRRASSPCV